VRQFAERFRAIFLSAVNLNLMVLVWIIFVTVDPFDTGPKLMGLRSVGYWAVTVLYSSALLSGFISVSDVGFPRIPAWGRRIVFSVVYGAVSVTLGRMVFIGFAAEPEAFGWPRLPHYAFGAAIGMLVFLMVDVFRYALARELPAEEEEKEGPRLLQRLPVGMRGALIRISAKDHFVEIHTEKGMHKIRMRFRDAMAELPDDLGMLVHRSHWVAVDQVDKMQQSGGKMSLRMKDGADVPVSRTFEPQVRAQDWG